MPISAGQLDPILLRLGIVCGLLSLQPDGSVAVNTGFFADPIGSLKGIASAHAGDLAALLIDLLGASSGVALGHPGSSASTNRSWSPITYLDADGNRQQTGCYVVSEQIADGDSAGTTVFGLGLTVERTEDGVTCAPYAYVPLIAVDAAGGVHAVLDQAADAPSAIELGFQVVAGEGTFGNDTFGFDGIRFAAALPLTAAPDIEVVLVNLRLPGADAEDRSLLDLIAHPDAGRWLETALSLIAGRVSDTASAATLANLLTLVTGGGMLPAPEWSQLPSPDIVTDWLFAIATTPGAAARLLETLYRLCRGIGPNAAAPDVTGSGTRQRPFVILLGGPGALALELTLAVVPEGAGNVTLYPGLRFATALNRPVPDVAVATQLLGTVEFAAVALGPAAASPLTPRIFPTFDIAATLVCPDPGQPLIALAASGPAPAALGMTIGSARAGIAYRNGMLTPSFALVDVTTGVGAWPSLDLTNFDADVGMLDQAASALLRRALDKLVQAGTSAALPEALCAALGLAPPLGYTTETWPASAQLLLGGGLPLLMANPARALGAYYAACLQASIAGRPALSALVPYLARLLGAPALAAVEGSGTAADPWRVPLVSGANGLASDLCIFVEPLAGGEPRLHAALDVDAPVVFGGTTLAFGATVGLIAFALPDTEGAGNAGATWLPGLSAELAIAGKGGALTLPAIAGVTLAAQTVTAGASRRPEVPLAWRASVTGLSLTSATGEPITVGDLSFGDVTTDWQHEIESLTPASLIGLGLGLLQNGGRPGTVLAAGLGLMPDFPALLDKQGSPPPGIAWPQGLSLPPGWPALVVSDAKTFFANPWADLERQLGAIFAADSAAAEPLLRLVAWASAGTLPPAGVSGSGTVEDPWTAPLGLWTLAGTVWRTTSGGGSALGFGLKGVFNHAAAAEIALAVSFRLDLGQVALSGAATVTPRLSIVAKVVSVNAGTPLVDRSQPASPALVPLVIEHVSFGFDVFADGVYPRVVFAGTRLPAGTAPADVVLARDADGSFGTSVTSDTLAALIAAAMDRLSTAAHADGLPLLQSLLGALETIGLVQAAQAGGYGVNAGAWAALMANPDGFIAAQLDDVFADPNAATELFGDVAAIIGFDPSRLPPGLAALPGLLSAIGLTRDTLAGYIPVVSQWVALAAHPIAYLHAQAAALAAQPDLRRQLLSKLATLGLPQEPVSAGPLTFTATSPVSFTVSLDDATAQSPLPSLAAALTLTIDLAGGGLSAALDVAAPAVGQGLSFRYATDADPSLVLVPAGPEPYAFSPLTLYPLPDPETYLAALGTRLPMQLLSVAVGRFIDHEVLPRAALAARLLDGLGLLRKAASGEQQVVGLLALFNNPLGWLLDPSRLGNAQGQFDLAKIGAWLAAIPAGGVSSPAGVIVHPSGENGLAVTGLPYGLSATLTAAEAQGLAIALAIDPSFAEPGLAFDANAAVSFAYGHAPTITGGITASVPLGANGTADRLAVALDMTGGITLSAQGALHGAAFGPIQVVPFPGINTLFAGQTTIALLRFVASRLSQASVQATVPLAKFLGEIAAFGKTIGITDVGSLMTTVAAMRTGPVAWLTSNLFMSGSNTGVAALAGLLRDTFGIAGVSASGGLLRYAPTSSRSPGAVAIEIDVGEQQGTLGLWLRPRVAAGYLNVTLDAGAALPVPVEPHVPYRFTLDAALAFDLAKATNGRLALAPAITVALQTGSDGELAFALAARVDAAASQPSLIAALLPTPQLAYGDAPAAAVDVTRWLKDLVLRFATPLVADATLLNAKVNNLLAEEIGDTKVTLGRVLSNAGLLRQAAGTAAYELADVATSFADKTWAQIVEGLIGAAMASFVSGDDAVPVLALGGDGSLSLVADTPPGGPTRYGIRLLLTDFVIASTTGANIRLQLGKPMTGESATQNWITDSASATTAAELPLGVTLYVVTATPAASGGAPSYGFHFRLALGSVGLDFDGAGAAPLVTVGGFTLGAVEPRIALILDQSDFAHPLIGGGVRADSLGIPLGPGFASDTSNPNPVAQSLLSSSGSANGGSSGGDAVNPTISATVAYIDDFHLAFRSPGDDSGGGVSSIWLPVQRAFGPLHCRRVGFETAGLGGDEAAGVMFDGSVALGGLTIDMSSLAITVPLKHPTDFSRYTLGLSGLGVSYSGGPVQVSGGLLEVSDPPGYAGELHIQTSLQSLTALGAFQQYAGGPPSLFGYLMLSDTIGGPPCFFVTGLAAGIGFNRDFIVPPPDEVTGFPLVAWAASPSSAPAAPNDALTALERFIPPKRGGYWLGLGVQFTSFELINSTALLVCQFGDDFEIDLLGVSTLTLPRTDQTDGSGGSPYVYAELGLEVVFRPDDGVLMASAILSSNSYVIDPSCHLTGGFAFYSWFGNSNFAGDFVVTLGGFASSYDAPQRYPVVPRLGISWQSGDVSITGDAYFALTPSCVMAGGALDASYESGNLNAWFTAYADFLINWHPYYYSADFGFSIGASYTIDCIVSVTFTAELSASLSAHGPPFAGEVTVSWSVISFTVPVGASQDDDTPGVLLWPEFASYFLPKQAQNPSDDPAVGGTLATLRVAGGLLGTASDGTWLVDGEHFVLRVESVAPVTDVTVAGAASGVTGASIGVSPMNLKAITSTLDLTLVELVSGAKPAALVLRPLTQGAPVATWGQQPWTPLPQGAALNDTAVIPGSLLAVTAVAPTPAAPSGPPAIALTALLKDTGSLHVLPLPLRPAIPAASRDGSPDAQARSTIAGTVMAVASARSEVIAAVAAVTGFAMPDGALDVLAAQATLLFQQPPMLGAPGDGGAAPMHAPMPRLEPVLVASPAPGADEAPVPVAAFLASPRRSGLAIRNVHSAATRRAHGLGALSRLASTSSEMASTLHAGATVLWKVPHAGPPPALRGDGSLALRVVTVTFPAWQTHEQFVAVDETGPIAIPDSAMLVAVTAVTQRSEAWSGWLPDTPMIQIAPDLFIAEHAVVRTQAPLATGRGRWRRADHGVWRGRALASANRVERRKGARCSGWIATRLPADIDHVTVSIAAPPGLAPDVQAGRAALKLTMRDSASGQPATLELIDATATDGLLAVTFRLATRQQRGDALIAQAQAEAGWQVIGVVGTAGRDGVEAAPVDVIIAARAGQTTQVRWHRSIAP